jgi:amidohydrolase family protein
MPSFTGMDAALEEALAGLAKTPIEYFRMLYVDSALFGAPHGVKCVLEFFGAERVLFATDAPLDTRGGAQFIPATISDIEEAVADETARAAIFHGNAKTVVGLGTAPQPLNSCDVPAAAPCDADARGPRLNPVSVSASGSNAPTRFHSWRALLLRGRSDGPTQYRGGERSAREAGRAWGVERDVLGS